MSRSTAVSVALVFAFTAPAFAQNTQGLPTLAQKEPKKTARLRYHATQAALYSALAHAQALESLAGEPGEPDTDIALSYVKTINRDINECRTNSNKMGQAETSVEKDDNLKAFRAELDKAYKAQDQAHQAIDGHGKLTTPAKETNDHLKKAAEAFRKVAESIDVKPLPAPKGDDDRKGE